MYSAVGPAVETLDCCSVVMGSIPRGMSVAIGYVTCCIQRYFCNALIPRLVATLFCSAAVVCRSAPLHSADSIGYLSWIFQDIIVGYESGDVAWIQNEDIKGYCRIPVRDNTKDI